MATKEINYETFVPSTLEETAKMMISDDYKVRFKGEYYQEKIRAEKLENFILRIEVGLEKDYNEYDRKRSNLEPNEPKHDCPLELLKTQLHFMNEKLRIFKKRAIYENIVL